MPGCCVSQCTNRSEKGFKMYRWRQSWLQFIGRSDLAPNAKICEVHFSSDQFAANRKDNRKLLRPDAIPDLLTTHREIVGCESEPMSESAVYADHAYVDLPTDAAEEEIQSDVDEPLNGNTTTPKVELKGRKTIKHTSMSLYEERLYDMNKMRMEQLMQESRQMHELKMEQEREYHKLRMKNERDQHAAKMKLYERHE